MARYTQDSVDRVRAAVDFVDLVGSRVDLRKAGVRRYVGLCPFHEERSPSFGIDPVEKLYHCFGCRAGGDVFAWVENIENVGFGEALELLADRYGVALERTEEDPRAAERRARRDRLLALLERTAAFYGRMLWESPEAAGAREYLASRGIEEAIAREFRVGYSPSAWDRVVTASGRAGYSLQEVLDAGLAQRSRTGGGPIDRFRGRLMFPWTDARGRVLGFGARALEEGQQPKYLNTAETDVFHKGRQVYGIQLARAAAAKAGAIVLVEGYTDVIALHQAGLRHAVGQMGTALTEAQAGELVKLAGRVVLCLDADAAGQDAMAKAAEVMRSVKRDADLRVVALPAGSDPADVVQRDGAVAMRSLLEGAVPFARWQVEHALRRGDTGTPEGREELLAQTHRIIGALPNGIVKQELIRTVADRLALSDALLESTFSRPLPSPRTNPPRRTPSPAAARSQSIAVPARAATGPAPAASARRPASPGDSARCPASPGDSARRPTSPGDSARRPASPGDSAPRPTSPGDSARAGSVDPRRSPSTAAAARPGNHGARRSPSGGDASAAGSGDSPRPPSGGEAPRGAPKGDVGGIVSDDFGRLDDRGGGPVDDAAIAALIDADPGREDDAPAPAAAVGPRSDQPRGRPDGAARRADQRAVAATRRPVLSDPALRALDHRSEVELSFLSFCIAFPVAGAARLGEIDVEASFSGSVARRAAEHLREHTEHPADGLPPDDVALAGLIAELVIRAGRADPSDPGALDRTALQLELSRIDRALAAASASRGPVFDLAAERQRVLGEIRKVAV